MISCRYPLIINPPIQPNPTPPPIFISLEEDINYTSSPATASYPPLPRNTSIIAGLSYISV